MQKLGEHAIVIGGSIAGLATARVLSNHYRRVTVMDRDVLPQSAQQRRGVPHGWHTHGLLARGREVLETLFPGLTEELVDQGAIKGDLLGDGLWFNHGVYLNQAPSGLTGLLLTRPMLEAYVRRRVIALENVHILERCQVLTPTFDAQLGRVTGVEFDADGNRQTLTADLVVDATGRVSHTPRWLQAFGFDAPVTETVEVGICYTTRLYRRRPHHIGGKLGVVVKGGAPDFRFGGAMAQEHDRWIVSFGGYFGDAAPTDEEGFKAFARTLPTSEVMEILNDAEPLSPFRAFRFPASVRRHYERLTRFPGGYLMVGDALSSFNPSYGQGMTVAVLEAKVLDDCLANGVDGLAQRFFSATAQIIDIPWQIAIGGDLANPKVEGTRTLLGRFFNWYVGKLHLAAAHDPLLATRFLEVVNLMAPPTALLMPGIALRVLRGNLGRRAIAYAGGPEQAAEESRLLTVDTVAGEAP